MIAKKSTKVWWSEHHDHRTVQGEHRSVPLMCVYICAINICIYVCHYCAINKHIYIFVPLIYIYMCH